MSSHPRRNQLWRTIDQVVVQLLRVLLGQVEREQRRRPVAANWIQADLLRLAQQAYGTENSV